MPEQPNMSHGPARPHCGKLCWNGVLGPEIAKPALREGPLSHSLLKVGRKAVVAMDPEHLPATTSLPHASMLSLPNYLSILSGLRARAPASSLCMSGGQARLLRRKTSMRYRGRIDMANVHLAPVFTTPPPPQACQTLSKRWSLVRIADYGKFLCRTSSSI